MHKHEQDLVDKWTVEGYDVIKVGIPDCILLKDGKIEFREIKRDNDPPTEHQKRAFELLKKHGFPVSIVRVHENLGTMGLSGGRLGPVEIPDELDSAFRKEILYRYGGKKGSLQKGLEQAMRYFVMLAPERVTMTKGELKEIEQVLLGECMATKADMNKKPALERTINTIMGALKLMKDLGVLHVEG